MKETGKIRTLTDKGFGFITVQGQRKDLFFHSSELRGVRFDDLKVDDEVEFEMGEGQKGPCAQNVQLLS